MKKALSLLLALVMCLSLCACGGGDNNTQADDKTPDPNENTVTGEEVTDGTNENNERKPLIYYDADGEAHIDEEVFPECLEFVDLSTDNWREYIKAYSYSYEEEKVEKDVFGEIISTEVVTHTGRVLAVDNERYHSHGAIYIELKDKSTGELTVYSLWNMGPTIGEDFNIDNYECTRVTGRICFLNVPVGEIPVAILIDHFVYVYPGTHFFDGIAW